MRPTSTQLSDEIQNTNLSDELYSIFLIEFNVRGTNYFNTLGTLPGITGGNLPQSTLYTFITAIAVNPSLITIFCSDEPFKLITSLLDGFNTTQVEYINDFLDEITLNVRLRNDALYRQRLAVLKEQIILSVTNNLPRNSSRQLEKVKEDLDRFEHNLVAYHYLRKIGYNSSDFRNSKSTES